MNGSASRVLFVFLIAALLVVSAPSSLTLAQSTSSNENIESGICDNDTAQAPYADAAYVQRVKEASQLRLAPPASVYVGQEFTAYKNVEQYSSEVTIEGFSQKDSLGDFRPADDHAFLIICLTIEPKGNQSKRFSLVGFYLENLDEEYSHESFNLEVTQYANESILGTEIVAFTEAELPANQETEVALVFDVQQDQDIGALYLSAPDDHSVLLGLSPNANNGAPTSVPEQTAESIVPSGRSFGEQILVTHFPNKWALTFDPNVEVRYFIGDQSITPRRGQFLVVWFDQVTTSNQPLPLGNFSLRASSGPGEQFATYDISREGTAALIITEYDWNPELMDNGVPYRTGVVFDIRPEDTHFELRYDTPGAPSGIETPVQIDFDA